MAISNGPSTFPFSSKGLRLQQEAQAENIVDNRKMTVQNIVDSENDNANDVENAQAYLNATQRQKEHNDEKRREILKQDK